MYDIVNILLAILSERIKWFNLLLLISARMGKKPNGVYKKTKSKRSPKTKKRLEIKRRMLEAKAARKKRR